MSSTLCSPFSTTSCFLERYFGRPTRRLSRRGDGIKVNTPQRSSLISFLILLSTMRSALLSLVSLATLWVSVAAQSSVEAFIAKQAPISKAGVFANIGPSGSKSHGAKVWSLLLSTTVAHCIRNRPESSLPALAKWTPTTSTPGPVMLPSSRRISSIRRFS